MNKVVFFMCLLSLVSCDFFQKTKEQQVIARVGNHFLYQNDIAQLVGAGTQKNDSLLIVKTYIDQWATQQLLMEKAKINLSDEKLKNYDALVSKYKKDLYTKGYVDIIATQSLNQEINHNELMQYYEQNKENFKLNEPLVQFRYIHLSQENKNIDVFKKQLFEFSEEDQKNLEEKAIQFKSYTFNDSLWIQVHEIQNKIKPLQQESSSKLLKKSNRFELKDSLGVYLIFVKDVLLRNEIAPLPYVKPSIEQIILNKRKLEIIRNLEKEILQDAIKNNDFEIYN